MPPVTESTLPADHIYTDHVHPWDEIVEYVCKLSIDYNIQKSVLIVYIKL
jgi:hypothetical protein